MNIIVDFDGTISSKDTIDLLLEMFGTNQPAIIALEQAWVDGHISALECLTKQLQLVDLSPTTLINFAQNLAIDSTFLPFYQRYKNRYSITIVSDGLQNIILPLLEKHGITDCPVYGGHFEVKDNRLASLSYPYHLNCPNGNGTCKCQISEITTHHTLSTVLIGDGRSDFCLAKKADLIFAKDKLAQFCKDSQIPYQEFRSFDDIKL